MIFCGIDPGKSGAVAFLDPEHLHYSAERMPILGKDIDGQALAKMLRSDLSMQIGLEKVHAMPKQGVKSMFSFGAGYGLIQGVIAALQSEGCPLQLLIVTPQQWKKTVLTGMDWKGTKECAAIFAQQMYPDINLTPGKCTKPHDGIADAVCIAEYMRLKFIGM